jgi:carbon-monoxide dehydrogenase large subunit
MGSRSLQLGGSALQQAAQEVREIIMSEAAEILEVLPDDLVLDDGLVGPFGAPEIRLPLAQVVETYLAKNGHGKADDGRQGIEATVRYQAEGDTFPFGSTAAVVSIDRETGWPTIERFVSVDDVGNVINPRLVEGQLIGGAVQGMAEALWEQVIYDRDGQLVSGSLMDYAVPKASWIPNLELERTVTPSPRNPLGAKGVGEAGTVHAPPAVANAIMDALRQFDVEPLDLPITDQKIWRIIHFGGQDIR